MPIHISNKKVNDIHVGSKKVLSAWVGTDRVYLASTLSMLIKGYTEKSGNSLLSANTPFRFTGKNLLQSVTFDSYKFIQEVKAGETYTVSGDYNYEGTSDSRFGIYVYAEKSSSSRRIASILVTGTYGERKSGTITVPEDGFLFFRLVRPENYLYFGDVQIEEGTLTDYEPYHETFYNPTEGFSLNGNEIAQDTFETSSGALDKEYETKTFNGSEEWTTTNIKSGVAFRTRIAGIKRPISNYVKGNLISNNYDAVTGDRGYLGDRGISVDFQNDYIYVIDPDFINSNVQTFKNNLSNNPLIITFQLATPQTYQKKHKVLPQWVKHCFDSSGRELETTITQ